MMASIPNMRSTPLPLPGSKPAPAGEIPPGDFAAQIPALPGLPVQPAALLPEAIVESVAPAVPSPDAAMTDETDDKAGAPENQADTPDADQAAPAAVVIPFLPVQSAVPAPQGPPAVSADQAVPPRSQEIAVVGLAGTPRRPAGDPGPAKTGLPLPLPAVTDAPEGRTKTAENQTDAPQDQTDATAIEAAVKELLQRKQGPAKQVAAAPKGQQPESARPEAAPVPTQAQPQTQPQAQPVAPVAILAPAAPEQLQPVLAPPVPQPAPLKAEAAATADGTRTTDLAIERQLDLARDAQWLDRLARDIARAGSDDQPLRFRLHPQTLGHLQVELQQGDHGTAVRLTVETEAARQILADAQPRLAAEARAQGVRIAETHVDLSGSGRHAPGDQRRQDEARQTPLIRTATGAGMDAIASPRSSARARPDRYA